LHLCKAAAVTLPIPGKFIFHMTLQLLRHLSKLLADIQHHSGSNDPLFLTVSTQIAASRLLQQLPAEYKTAQQELQQLKPNGWCGVPCRQCEHGLYMTTKHGYADAGQHPGLPLELLQFYTVLLQVWPGSLGALGSIALGPIFIPAAQLTLSSFQYVCKHAGEQSSSSNSTSDSTLPPALVQLGTEALGTCAALTRAVGDVSHSWHYPTGAEAAMSNLPQHKQDLMSSLKLLSALVATLNADTYGQHDADSIAASAAPVVPDLSDPYPLLYMTAGLCPDDNMPAAAWQQLCEREGRAREAGQGLLPPLQQQLLDTLGCNSKEFVWIAPLWKACQDDECMYSVTLPVCLVSAAGLKRRLRSLSAAPRRGNKARTPAGIDTAVQQFLLLPTLMLRRELHQQRMGSFGGARPLFNTLRASAAVLQLLRFWEELQDLKPNTGASSAAAGSGTTAAAATAAAAAIGRILSDSLFSSTLHEVLQLHTHLLLAVIQAAQPGSTAWQHSTATTAAPAAQAVRAAAAAAAAPALSQINLLPQISALLQQLLCYAASSLCCCQLPHRLLWGRQLLRANSQATPVVPAAALRRAAKNTAAATARTTA
jgi:hypothetical protein